MPKATVFWPSEGTGWVPSEAALHAEDVCWGGYCPYSKATAVSPPLAESESQTPTAGDPGCLLRPLVEYLS